MSGVISFLISDAERCVGEEQRFYLKQNLSILLSKTPYRGFGGIHVRLIWTKFLRCRYISEMDLEKGYFELEVSRSGAQIVYLQEMDQEKGYLKLKISRSSIPKL